MNRLGKWVLIGAALLLAGKAIASQGRPLPMDEETEETKLLLAQLLKIEAESNRVDHQAIPWTLYRWWNRRGRNITFDGLIRAYSSGFHDGAPARALQIRRMQWEEFSPAVRGAVEAFLAGRLPDPSRGAIHWAARHVNRGGTYVEVTPPGAANRYWRERASE